jgi:ATP-dependent Clp protease adapter protein ClpS
MVHQELAGRAHGGRHRELARNVTRLLPPYCVLLHNDDHDTMDHAVYALVESVPKLSVREAGHIMLEAHLRAIARVRQIVGWSGLP